MSTLAQLLQELKEFRQAVSDSQTNARSAGMKARYIKAKYVGLIKQNSRRLGIAFL